MAFRKKYTPIFAEQPDILVIQECENIERLNIDAFTPIPSDIFWYGDKAAKGVGLFSFDHFHFKLHEMHNPEYRYVLPIVVTGQAEYLLFAIWAMPHAKISAKSYVGQIWGAINYYKELFNDRTILIGDFNSHVQWDRKYRKGNHSDVVAVLDDFNIKSVYHHLNKVNQGDELQQTFFLYKHQDKPYHMDYCFVSTQLLRAETNCQIGKYGDWMKLSDHVPLIVDGLK